MEFHFQSGAIPVLILLPLAGGLIRRYFSDSLSYTAQKQVI